MYNKNKFPIHTDLSFENLKNAFLQYKVRLKKIYTVHKTCKMKSSIDLFEHNGVPHLACYIKYYNLAT